MSKEYTIVKRKSAYDLSESKIAKIFSGDILFIVDHQDMGFDHASDDLSYTDFVFKVDNEVVWLEIQDGRHAYDKQFKGKLKCLGADLVSHTPFKDNLTEDFSIKGGALIYQDKYQFDGILAGFDFGYTAVFVPNDAPGTAQDLHFC